MTKSNNEWVPEIGQVVMASWVDDDGDLMDAAVEVSAYRGDKAWVTCCGLDKVFKLTDIKFRSIKTEAEKRREIAVAEMKSLFHKNVCLPDDVIFETIYDSGWAKTNEITTEDIRELWKKSLINIEDMTSTDIEGFARMVAAHIRGELHLWP